jgi:CRP-like cAMP-binding protein
MLCVIPEQYSSTTYSHGARSILRKLLKNDLLWSVTGLNRLSLFSSSWSWSSLGDGGMHKFLPARSAMQNLLLCSLPQAECQRLLPHLQPVRFSLGQIICEPGERIEYCYFPTESVISMLYTTRDGSTAEMGLVGNEGVLGIAAFLGGESTCSRALVAVAGDTLRLPARLLHEEFSHRGPLQDTLLRYTQAFITQISQTAVCNRLHSVEQRLCRWLLMCQDRKNCFDLLMTQELIANMLGGRRESVTVAAGHLQDAGMIHYCRGRINILNRDGLESHVCECYRVVEDEFDRLLGREHKPELSHAGATLEEAGRLKLGFDRNSRAESSKHYGRPTLQRPPRWL